MEETLATQPVIEQAKGMLMILRSWSADEAFAALREISQHTNVKLHDVAAVLVAAGSRAEAGPADRQLVGTVLAEVRRTMLGSAFNPSSQA